MKRSHHTESFKQEVVELSYRRDSIKQLAKELGLKPGIIYRWRRERADYVPERKTTAPQSLSELELENRRLKRALKEVEEDREILKKAIDIFSQRGVKSSN